jgi:hypothetical protein
VEKTGSEDVDVAIPETSDNEFPGTIDDLDTLGNSG